jgi:hypothetical protein
MGAVGLCCDVLEGTVHLVTLILGHHANTEVLKVQCSANTQNGQCSADSRTWNSNFDTPTNVQSVLESVNPRQEIIFYVVSPDLGDSF